MSGIADLELATSVTSDQIDNRDARSAVCNSKGNKPEVTTDLLWWVEIPSLRAVHPRDGNTGRTGRERTDESTASNRNDGE